MKLVNPSHLQRHCTNYRSNILMNLVGSKVAIIYRVVMVKVTHITNPYYVRKTARHFDIEEALRVMEEVAKNPHKTKKNVDYKMYFGILQNVYEDRLKYGDMIPDTSDVYSKEYREKLEEKEFKYSDKYKAQKKRERRERDKNRILFREKWNNLDWNSLSA